VRRAASFGPSRARRRPFRSIGFDTEDQNGIIIQACFYGDGGNLERCYHVDDVGTPEEVRRQAMKFLMLECSSRVETRIAAVNLEYDIMNVAWPEFFTPDVFDVLLVRGRWIYAKLKGTNVLFFDVGNHMPQSVKKWGELLDCPKLDFNPRSVAYCMRDAEIAYRGAELLREMYEAEGGEMRYTAPASALEIYRRRFMSGSFEPVDDARRELYRDAYYGGRTEVFRHGKVFEPLTAIDVKSMYPHAMLESIPDYETGAACRSIPDSREYVADVTVTVPDQHVPPLPVRRDGKLIFPVGTWRGAYASPELRHAETCGAKIDRVHDVVRFERSEPFLRSYVEEFYPKKERAERDGNEALRRFYKTGLLNSLYGKFGTGGACERLAWIDADRSAYDFVESEPDAPAYANVIWSAHITAIARVRLHRALLAVDDPVYCDTDSVIFCGASALTYGSRLGDWELKGHYSRGEFWRPKAYAMTGRDGDRVVHVRGVAFDFADKVIEDAYVEFTAPLRMREAVRRGERPNVWVKHSKTLDKSYDKRSVLRGGRTEPVRLWL